MPDQTAVLYNALRRDGTSQSLALRVGADGTVEDMEPPPAAALPRGFWGVKRPARSEDGQARLVRPLEDTPFYTRSEIRTPAVGAGRRRRYMRAWRSTASPPCRSSSCCR